MNGFGVLTCLQVFVQLHLLYGRQLPSEKPARFIILKRSRLGYRDGVHGTKGGI